MMGDFNEQAKSNQTLMQKTGDEQKGMEEERETKISTTKHLPQVCDYPYVSDVHM